MPVLIAGLIIFFGVHLIPTMSRMRTALQQRIGALPYRGLFSLAALIGFVLIIWGYGQARLDPIVVFTPPLWARYVTYILMLPVFILLLEFMLPGRIAAAVKHPMLTAIKFWALAHFLSNGMLADLLLFGGFLAYAVIDRISVKKRGLASVETGPNAMRNDIISIAGGLAIYLAFMLWLHPILIGVPVY